jgi:hypothetical protein
MYDHDPQDIDLLGWPEFIARQWESIFVGYRTGSGLRRTGRRWSDLFQAGLGCSQELADELVRAQIIDRVDRNLEDAYRSDDLLAAMYGVVADLPEGLKELASDGIAVPGPVLARTGELLAQAHIFAFGQAGGAG